MPESFELEINFKADPERIYNAWLDSEAHTAFTQSRAKIDPAIDGAFTAWDGYISGTNVELEPGKRIVQNWRTSEFPDDAPDSLLELILEKTETGSKLILKHSNIPDGQGGNYKDGWNEFYFEGMKTYFE